MAGSLLPEINCEFLHLDQSGHICAEYVWIGGSGEDIRSKTKVLDHAPKSVSDLPVWNYDGSSTGQAPGHDSEVLIKPATIFRDPFRQGNNIIVLCDTYVLNASNTLVPLQLETITGSNTRATAQAVFENSAVKSQHLWFGIEQEYTLFHKNGKTPLGWPEGGFPRPQGPYYCAAGVENSFGRDIVEAHLKACMYAGVKLSGANAEVMPAQWEYQVGPCEGIESGDHVWMARYIMYRVCEKYGVQVSFYPKPIEGDWNGTGCHTNVSTAAMRDPKNTETYTPTTGPFSGQQLKGGIAKIIEAVDKMGPKHQEHISVYGKDNSKRLTGRHETANIDTWRYGVADRGASVRITRDSVVNGYGYFEDRRPASNMDPYVVTSKIAATILL